MLRKEKFVHLFVFCIGACIALQPQSVLHGSNVQTPEESSSSPRSVWVYIPTITGWGSNPQTTSEVNDITEERNQWTISSLMSLQGINGLQVR